MSKTFDEGGAKGLLLANLAVGSGGCKIIFDSSLDDVEDNDCTAQEDNNVGSDESTPVDVTTLTTKLSSLVAASGQSIEDLPLVPQLASLRHEFATLQKDGFVDNQVIAVSALICGGSFNSSHNTIEKRCVSQTQRPRLERLLQRGNQRCSTGGVNEASRDLENSSWCRWSPIKFPFCNEQLKSGLLFFAPTKVPFGHKGLKCRGSHSSANKVSLPRQPVWEQEEPHSRRAWWLERRASTCARSKTILSTLLVDFVSREAFDCSNTLPHILTPAKVSFFPSCSLG